MPDKEKMFESFEEFRKKRVAERKDLISNREEVESKLADLTDALLPKLNRGFDFEGSGDVLSSRELSMRPPQILPDGRARFFVKAKIPEVVKKTREGGMKRTDLVPTMAKALEIALKEAGFENYEVNEKQSKEATRRDDRNTGSVTGIFFLPYDEESGEITL